MLANIGWGQDLSPSPRLCGHRIGLLSEGTPMPASPLPALLLVGLTLLAPGPGLAQPGGIGAGFDDLILAQEGLLDGGDPGLVDSAAALEAALLALGRAVLVLSQPAFESLTLAPAGVSHVWVLTGTYPNDYRLSAAELELLASWSEGGTGIYLEGADHWGFNHVPSSFDDRDGVGLSGDGNDTFTAMVPAGSLIGLVPATSSYAQDQPGSDWTDQLNLAPEDPGVASAEVLFIEPLFGYATTIHASPILGSSVLVQSWEFGGYPAGDRVALVEAYLGLLAPAPGFPFVRGDANGDGDLDLADAVRVLEALFEPGAMPLTCELAADANDDDAVDLADAIHLLAVLFPVGTPVAIPPPTHCGPDPTPCPDAPPCSHFPACP